VRYGHGREDEEWLRGGEHEVEFKILKVEKFFGLGNAGTISTLAAWPSAITYFTDCCDLHACACGVCMPQDSSQWDEYIIFKHS